MIFSKFFSKKKLSGHTIGVLYICTGKYHIFWDKFYKSAENYFCKHSVVHYFVFTEHPIMTYGNARVHHIVQPKMGWPYDTLKRFHIFLGQKDSLEKMDYLFFFNANMVFKKKVKENDILPNTSENGLVSVIHPHFYDHSRIAPFEDNKESVAFVDASAAMNYFQGCLSGGTKDAYLKMAEEIQKMVDVDLANSIIGKWWDESYMNKYFQEHPPKLLSPSYAYPESAIFPFTIKIVQLDKSKSGGHDFLREI